MHTQDGIGAVVRHHAQHHLVPAEQQGASHGDAFGAGLVITLVQAGAFQQLEVAELGPGVASSAFASITPTGLPSMNRM